MNASASKGERDLIVNIAGTAEPLLFQNLGNGMRRNLGIALALLNAKDGILLIDEFENGLSYSVQLDLRHHSGRNGSYD